MTLDYPLYNTQGSTAYRSNFQGGEVTHASNITIGVAPDLCVVPDLISLDLS